MSVSCKLGFHKWQHYRSKSKTVSIEYRRCDVCGKIQQADFSESGGTSWETPDWLRNTSYDNLPVAWFEPFQSQKSKISETGTTEAEMFETKTIEVIETTKRMLYLSGPYSDIMNNNGNVTHTRKTNVHIAREIFVNAWKTTNWYVFCPHTHSNEMEVSAPEVPWEAWLEFDLRMLAYCDALLGWRISDTYSRGSTLEILWALRAGMPVYLGEYSTEFSIPAPGELPTNSMIYGKWDTKEINKLYDVEKSWKELDTLIQSGAIPDPVMCRSADNYPKLSIPPIESISGLRHIKLVSHHLKNSD